jgi:Flp pilus assembly protein TadD, contains TPR repeats
MRAPSAPLPRWLFPLLFLAALIAYWPTLSAGFIWDDAGHVTRPDLQSLSGLVRIWFEVGATQQYYPLLHSAFWLEHKFWGDAAFGYHLLNIFLHAANACLFAKLLHRLALPGAAFAAFLFALHPVCVESVAWISEQKNTLSTLLYLTAASTYLNFHDTRSASPSSTLNPQLSTYLLASALFLAALLTKSVTATLPAALLVLLWWRQGSLHFRRDVLPLLPWFVLALVAGLHTAHFERTQIGADGAAFDLTFTERLLLAGRIPWFYLGKLLWPVDLIFIYPRWTLDTASPAQWLFVLATLALLAAAFFASKHYPWARSALAALLLFGGTLFPVLGFVNVYPFLFSYVADHFQYLATLPILAAFAATSTHLLLNSKPKTQNPKLLRLALPVLLILATLTFQQSRTYHDTLTLWQTTATRNPTAWIAHNNLALALTEGGRIQEAITHLESALALRPDYPQALSNLGDNLTRLGRPLEALPHLERALTLQPNFADAHNNLGSAYAALDRYTDAIPAFERALALNPRHPVAHRNLGFAIAASGRNADAVPHFTRAVELSPRDPQAHLGLAIALLLSHRFAAAEPHFHRAIELDPANPAPRLALARALQQQGRHTEAESQLRAARRLQQ